jgi:SAM-dependent methyltransferase
MAVGRAPTFAASAGRAQPDCIEAVRFLKSSAVQRRERSSTDRPALRPLRSAAQNRRRRHAGRIKKAGTWDMIARWSDALLSIAACPRCRSRIIPCADADGSRAYRCTNARCGLADEGFPLLNEQPVLIDFDASIVDRAGIVGRNGGSVQSRDVDGRWLRTHVHRLLCGHNHNARRIAAELMCELKARSRKPRLLIVGGGTVGTGSSSLCSDRDVEAISLDIYASPHTTFVADGHRLPLVDGSVDAVWIQAVLEHVLDPPAVVAEIHRVLKPDGVVFADTPFMQQVHEGIYDFTRFTLHGHRWLFRRFEVIDAGVTRGAGTGLVWSIRYFIRALTRNSRASTILTLPFFWLRYADPLLDNGMSADGASGVFFLGRRSDTSIEPKDMVGFYDDLRRLHDGRPHALYPPAETADVGRPEPRRARA